MNFARMSGQLTDHKKAKVVILPLPYPGESLFAPKLVQAPGAILKASADLSLYDIATRSEPFLKGIHTHDPLNLPADREEAIIALEREASALFQKDKMVVSLGGDPLISEGLVKAASNRYEDLTLVRLDAQAGLGKNGIMAKIRPFCPSVILGVRSMEKEEWKMIDRDRLILARDLIIHGLNAAMDAVDQLSDHVYLSIDMDIFDPSSVPFVPAPEPGGLDWYLVNALIREIASERKIVGMDLVGLLPQEGFSAPDYLAAKLIYRILSMNFSQQLSL